MANRILDMDNVERTRMALAMSNNADSTDVVSSSDHAQIARIKFDVVRHLPSGDVNYDGVIDLKRIILV
jgi:hypothetical protein